jgi:hypothetical protein
MGVTVLIPAYENAELVEVAARSAVMQQGIDVSVFVFDDSVSNAVEDRLRNMSADRLTYVRHQRTGRPIDNWNDALASVTTGHVVLLHQDECFTHPNALAEGITAMEGQSGSVYIFGHVIREADGRERHRSPFWAWALSHWPVLVYFSNHIGSPSSVMFERANMVMPFRQDLRWLVDLEWFFSNFGQSKIVFSRGIDLLSRADVGLGITKSLDVALVERCEVAMLMAEHRALAVRLGLRARLLKLCVKDWLGAWH